MDKIRSKYEVILGFVTLIVSLSAFKEELSRISLDLGYTTITVAQYFLYCVYAFALCLYFYILELIVRDTRIGSWKIFDYVIKFAFFLFVFILSTPLIVLFNLAIYNAYLSATKDYQATMHYILVALNYISFVLAIIASLAVAVKILRDMKRVQQLATEELEIIELGNANKLFEDGYYSHSVLETFKVLETHLYKKIFDKDIRVSKHRFDDIIQLALREKFISEQDLPYIKNLRSMRNIAAHSETSYTRQQAETALIFVRNLLSKPEK